MASVNKVILLGNCGRDPEVRYAADGGAITTLSIATSSRVKDKGTGDWREETEWHRVVFFGRSAEVAGEYLKKGRSAYVEGRLRTRKWTDKDGNERYTTEIVGDVLQLLGGRDSGGGDEGGGGGGGGYRPRQAMSDDSGGGFTTPAPAARAAAPRPAAAKPATGFDDMDDDIPF